MTRASIIAKMRDYAWLIGAACGIATATGFQWATGGSRITALESGQAALATRVAALEGNADILNALALDLCLRTTEPRIRAPLECFRRESGDR
jgi:hypothetical protein